jgi:hypothetical protein
VEVVVVVVVVELILIQVQIQQFNNKIKQVELKNKLKKVKLKNSSFSFPSLHLSSISNRYNIFFYSKSNNIKWTTTNKQSNK